MSMPRSFIQTAVQSWRSQNGAIRIMRIWLGITWIYAGWVKATDSGFLTSGSSTFIGTQLSAYSTQSPVGFTFNKLIEHAVLVGAFVMLSEFAIGLATLLWVAPRLSAAAGFAMSIGLWLASSFHSTPYFLASDTAYAVLWLTYLLLITGKRKGFQMSVERRGFLRVGITGALAVAFAGVGKYFAKAAPATTNSAATTGTKIVKLTSIKVGGSKNFVTKNGTPAILFRTKKGVFAYSAICTHRGCTVVYSSASKSMQCPCHGAQYDPLNSAKVLSGPTQTPLPKIKVAISGAWVVLV